MVEHEVLERGLGVFFPVEDGGAVIHLGSPEAVVSSPVTDDMFTGDVLAGEFVVIDGTQ